MKKLALVIACLSLSVSLPAGGIFSGSGVIEDADGGVITINLIQGDTYGFGALPSFITTSAANSGAGPLTLEFLISPLPQKSSRSGLINLGLNFGTGFFPVPIEVYQTGPRSELVLNSNPFGGESRIISTSGSMNDFRIGSNELQDSLLLNANFATIEESSSPNGSFLNTDPNPGNEFRYLQITDQNDYQTVLVQPVEDSNFSVPVNSLQFPNTGFPDEDSTSMTLSVTASPDNTWLTYSTVPWLRVDDPPVRTGSSDLVLRFYAEDVPQHDQFGLLIINDEVIPLDAQSAVIETWCSANIDEMNISDNSGGEFTIWVSNGYNPRFGFEIDCRPSISAISDQSWIEILESSAVHVNYRVLPNNTGSPRSGMITIRPGDHASHTVIQTNLGKSNVSTEFWKQN